METDFDDEEEAGTLTEWTGTDLEEDEDEFSFCTSCASTIDLEEQRQYFPARRKIQLPAKLELLEATHRGLHRFHPRHRDEIEVDIGDPVYVQKEAYDLWCEGT